MQTYDLRFGDTLIQMPWWWLDGLLLWLGLMGLIVFLFGRRLVRPLFAVMGLTLGALLGLALVKTYWADTSPTLFVAGGALIGAVAAFALYRVGMGLVLALLVGLAAPAGMLIFQGKPGPAIEEPIVQLVSDIREAVSQVTSDDQKSADLSKLPSMVDIADKSLTQIKEATTTWWNEQDTSYRVLLMTLAGGLGVLGFLIGLVFPGIGGALATAFVGSMMMIGGIGRLVGTHLNMDIMPDTARNLIMMIVVMTLIGALIQWMILRPGTDK